MKPTNTGFHNYTTKKPAKKKKANFNPEYSVWKPAVSSDSASAKSNGPLLVSAVLAIRKIIKAIQKIKKK